jgi:hypothetical protein
MEPRHEERKDREPWTEAKEAKPRRFRIVKLEERIAPCSGRHLYRCGSGQCGYYTQPPGACM